MREISRRTFLKSSSATALAAVTLGYAPRGMRQDGATLPVPPVLDGRREGDLRVYGLTAQRGSTEILPGVVTETYGYNDDMLGPVVRLTRGDRVRLDVTNRLAEPTTCHWHGLHVPAVADGGPHQIIQPDTTWRASFTVSNEAATYWYHSHLMERTGEQVYKGLAGMIIVDDPAHEELGLPTRYGVDDFPLVVQDRRFSRDGELLYLQAGMDAMMGMLGNRLLVNGALTPTMRAPAQLVRLRLLNGSNARIYDFGFSDYRPFFVIASDGGLLPEPLSRRRLSMATGERYEIVVDLSGGGGETLQLRSYPTGDSEGFPIVDIFVDPAVEVAPARVPDVLRPAPAIDAREVSRTRDFALSMGMMGMMGGMRAGQGGGMGGGGMGGGGMGGGMRGGGMRGRGPGGFTINGVSMDMGTINETVKLGAVEEWRIINESPMTHPFHIHDVQFLVRERNGAPPPPHERGWKDTVQVRPQETVSILAHFTDYADPVHPYMYHCHILEHEDRGMMGQFVVVE
jgi:blue copper oxidase